jgi:hypothetical protein
MKYYYFEVCVTYDGLEFIDRCVTQCEGDFDVDIESNFGHDDGDETLELTKTKEISKHDFDVLAKYL